MMTTENAFDLNTITVAEIALSFPQTFSVLNNYKIDYCAQGKHTLKALCESMKLDTKKVWDDINEVIERHRAEHLHFQSWNPSLIIDFVLQHHHTHAKGTANEIKGLLSSLNGSKDNDPALDVIHAAFIRLADALHAHMEEEEEFVFPVIRNVAAVEEIWETPPALAALQSQIVVLEIEHDHLLSHLDSIRMHCDNYRVPIQASAALQLLYIMLEEFDRNLRQHLHIENSILFPKVKV